ncbi:transglutaminase family protein [Alphaproteobacteria bacterium GH1-50]|uniref:Transglutaminase family protein n=1 Tax=Kangsaoukella pontilimi TaxID=2691042 RepID=A0A7C9IRB5_9RHOB|nr:transglutaminase domain-containing protein [Kangsaoukella pontilimi]MXQ08583.1 transglutaminase family protein [Kangsaoukella pontilimi]
MRLNVTHKTTYRFDQPIRRVVQSLRLWPSEFEGQIATEWNVDIPGSVRGSAFRNGAGDWIETSTVTGPIDEVMVTVTGTVETTDLSGVLRGHRERVPPEAYLRTTRFTRPDTALAKLAEGATKGADSPLKAAHDLANAIRDAIAYTPGETDSHTTASEALAKGAGVCQDHTHALIAAAQTLEIPARYVVGYLHAEGSIAEASHAWAELWVEGLGWVGFDPANGVSPDENYIRIGSGLDSVDAALIRGVSQGAGSEELDVDVQVSAADQ